MRQAEHGVGELLRAELLQQRRRVRAQRRQRVPVRLVPQLPKRPQRVGNRLRPRLAPVPAPPRDAAAQLRLEPLRDFAKNVLAWVVLEPRARPRHVREPLRVHLAQVSGHDVEENREARVARRRLAVALRARVRGEAVHGGRRVDSVEDIRVVRDELQDQTRVARGGQVRLDGAAGGEIGAGLATAAAPAAAAPRPRPRRAGAAASARVGTAREARLGATLPRGGAEGLANAAKAVRACAMGRDATRLLDKPPSLRGDDDDAFRVGGWRDYACDARAGVRSANALQRAAVLSAFGGTSRRGRGARGYASAAGATRCAVPSPHPPRKAAGKASRKARENGRIVGSGARKNSSGVRCVPRTVMDETIWRSTQPTRSAVGSSHSSSLQSTLRSERSLIHRHDTSARHAHVAFPRARETRASRVARATWAGVSPAASRRCGRGLCWSRRCRRRAPTSRRASVCAR